MKFIFLTDFLFLFLLWFYKFSQMCVILSCHNLQLLLEQFTAECQANEMRISEARVLSWKRVDCPVGVESEVMPPREELEYLKKKSHKYCSMLLLSVNNAKPLSLFHLPVNRNRQRRRKANKRLSTQAILISVWPQSSQASNLRHWSFWCSIAFCVNAAIRLNGHYQLLKWKEF